MRDDRTLSRLSGPPIYGVTRGTKNRFSSMTSVSLPLASNRVAFLARRRQLFDSMKTRAVSTPLVKWVKLKPSQLLNIEEGHIRARCVARTNFGAEGL